MSESGSPPNQTPEQANLETVLISDPDAFQRVFDHLHEFAGLLRPDGSVLQANRTALQFAEIDIGSVMNKPIWESRWCSISAETQERMRADVFRASKGEFIRRDERVLGAGENTVLVDYTLKPLADAEGRVQYLIPEGKPYADDVALSDPAQVLVEADRVLSKVRQQLVVACSYCHRIRDAGQTWHKISEATLKSAAVRVSHGMCPLCESLLLKSMDEQVLVNFVRSELQSGFAFVHAASTEYLVGKTEDARAAIENAKKVAATVIFWLAKNRISEPVSLSLAERLQELEKAIETLGASD